jgi:hypothetical protein
LTVSIETDPGIASVLEPPTAATACPGRKVCEDVGMHLKPLLVTRVANVLPGLILGALGVGFWLDRSDRTPHALLVVGVGLSAALGLYLAVRGYRQGAKYGPDGIEVRGLLRTRRIAKARITEITDFPAVRWTAASGRARWTPIFAFFGLEQMAPFVERHNAACIERLQNWDDRRRPAARRNPARIDRRTRNSNRSKHDGSG